MNNVNFQQHFDNLPNVIRNSRRFFIVGADKVPHGQGWTNPANQIRIVDRPTATMQLKNEYLAFDTTGHGVDVDYLFLDFDHVLDAGNGDFVNDAAKNFYNDIVSAFPNVYCEKSISGTGLHIFMIPTQDRFADVKVTAQNGNGVLYFDRQNNSKLEVFYNTAGRFCLVTGNLFNCKCQLGNTDGSDVPQGEQVDKFFEKLLEVVSPNRNKPKPNTTTATVTKDTIIDTYYDYARACAMLDCIITDDVSDTEWLAIQSACKNLGIPYYIVDNFNRHDPDRYNEIENRKRWNSLNDFSFGIETLHGIAKRYGYDEATFKRDYYGDTIEKTANDDVKFINTKDVITDCPINLTVPLQFDFSKKGLVFHSIDKKTRKVKDIHISYSAMVITRRFKSPQTGIVQYELAYLDLYGKWQKAIVPAQILADSRKILSLAEIGADVTSGYSGKLVEYFRLLINGYDNPKKIPTVRIFNQPGWVDDTCQEFIYPAEGENYIVHGMNFDFKRAFAVRGDKAKWLDMMVKVLETSPTVRFVFGVALAAPLVKVLGIRNEQVHLTCPSGSGKTGAVKMALSVFGDPKVLCFKLNATSNSLESLATVFNDFPHCVDELQSVKKILREDLDTLIYNYESGKVRTRNTKNNELRDLQYFSGIRLSTGEQTITKEFSGEGAISRLLELTSNDYFTNDFARELHKFSEQNFGHFGRMWIDYICANKEKFIQVFSSLEEYLENNYPDNFPNHHTIVAAAYTALSGFTKMVGRHEMTQKLITSDCVTIMTTLPIRNKSTNAARAIDTVAEFVSTHGSFFRKVDDTGEPVLNVDNQSTYEIYGYRLRNGDYGIFPRVLREKVLNDFPDDKACIRGFHDLGYLVESKCNNNRPYQKGVKVDGNTKWLYVFKKSALFPDTDEVDTREVD